MSCLHYQADELYLEEVGLKTIANTIGTPCYAYSKAALEKNWRTFDTAFAGLAHRICYAVKANSNIAILNLFAKLGTGFDIVSVGELERVLAAGGDPKKIVFSGVGKQRHEIERAIRAGIFCFNVESEPELERLQAIATDLKTRVDIALRINPNVDPLTHAYISTGLSANKFGVDIDNVLSLCTQIASYSALRLIGIASHIGSQLVELQPFVENLRQLRSLYQQLRDKNIILEHIDIGGGFGITYRDEQPPTIHQYANAVREIFANCPVEIIAEPGRALVGNTGVLITRIEYIKQSKQKNFAIVDAGMNDLLRPALYQAWQNILPVERRRIETKTYEIAGPVCESADFLGKDRALAILPGDLLAVDGAGAYGFSMSSNYNSRCRPAEVLIDGPRLHQIRRRETIADLFAAEYLLI